MPLIVTPQQLSQRGDLYHQLASLTSAGIGLIPALELILKNPPSRRFAAPLKHLISKLNLGATFSEALTSLGQWMPVFDISLIKAGEQSGRMDACFGLLRDYYKDRAKLARGVLSDLAYPAFVLHAAIIVFPMSLLTGLVLKGDVMGFLLPKLAILIPLYGSLLALGYALQGRREETWRAVIEKIASMIPVLSGARRNLALARIAASLEALISAGMTIVEAWDLAAAACGSPALRRAVAHAKPRILAGDTPGEMLQESRQFPDLFASMYRTAELSGQLDDALRRLQEHYQEEGSRKLKAFSQWVPRMIYILIMLGVGYQVISFYSGYFEEINKIM